MRKALIYVAFAASLFAESKTEKDLRAQIVAQTDVIADLRARLLAVKSQATRQSGSARTPDSAAMKIGEANASTAAEMSRQAAQSGRDISTALAEIKADTLVRTERYSRLMAAVQHESTMRDRLLVLLCTAFLVQFFTTIMFVRRRS